MYFSFFLIFHLEVKTDHPVRPDRESFRFFEWHDHKDGAFEDDSRRFLNRRPIDVRSRARRVLMRFGCAPLKKMRAKLKLRKSCRTRQSSNWFDLNMRRSKTVNIIDRSTPKRRLFFSLRLSSQLLYLLIISWLFASNLLFLLLFAPKSL